MSTLAVMRLIILWWSHGLGFYNIGAIPICSVGGNVNNIKHLAQLIIHTISICLVYQFVTITNALKKILILIRKLTCKSQNLNLPPRWTVDVFPAPKLLGPNLKLWNFKLLPQMNLGVITWDRIPSALTWIYSVVTGYIYFTIVKIRSGKPK